jgi:hypothetical protein
MSIKKDFGLIEKYKELEKVGSAKVTILHDQVLEIVVGDLIAKYKSCKKFDNDYVASFEKVLRFYLTEDEMKEIEEI